MVFFMRLSQYSFTLQPLLRLFLLGALALLLVGCKGEKEQTAQTYSQVTSAQWLLENRAVLVEILPKCKGETPTMAAQEPVCQFALEAKKTIDHHVGDQLLMLNLGKSVVTESAKRGVANPSRYAKAPISEEGLTLVINDHNGEVKSEQVLLPANIILYAIPTIGQLPLMLGNPIDQPIVWVCYTNLPKEEHMLITDESCHHQLLL